VKNGNNHIERLTAEIMEKYIHGGLTDHEMHQVEKLMLHSEFDQEAVEGIESLPEGAFSDDMAVLQSRLKTRVSDSSKTSWWRIAAVFLLLAAAGVFIVDLVSPEAPQITENSPAPAVEKEPEAKTSTDSLVRDEDTTERSGNEDALALLSDEPESEDNMETVMPEKAASDMLPELRERAQATASVPTQILKENIPNNLQAINETPPIHDTLPQFDVEEVILEETEAYGIIRGEDIGPVTKKAGKPIEQLIGKVIDRSGAPLSGVNVTVKGTTQGTVTNQKGEFELNLPEASDPNIMVSFIGMQSQELKVPHNDSVTVVLAEDVTQLSEVVITQRNIASNYIPFEATKPSGGMEAYEGYLEANVHYPKGEKEEGDVVVVFNVQPDGTLTDFNVRRSPGDAFSDEAIRLIKEGPVWVPARKYGQPVEDKAKVKVSFKPKSE
jgi:TonB family protein